MNYSTRICRPLTVCLSLALATSLGAQISMTMEVEVERKGKIDEDKGSTLRLVSDGTRTAVITETDGVASHIIIDAGDNTMTTIATDRDGVVTAVKMPQLKLGGSRVKPFDGEIQATGETKDLLGYRAEKYIITDGGDVTEAWIADVPGFDYAMIGESLTRNRIPTPTIPGVDQPVTLEGHTATRKGKEVVHLYVRAIATGAEVDRGLLEVPAGTQVQDMSALFGGGSRG